MDRQRSIRVLASLLILVLLASCNLVSGIIGGGTTLGVTPTSVDLGLVATGESNSANVTVENLSGTAAAVTASAGSAWLTVSDAAFSVPAGATETLGIQGACSVGLEGTTANGTVTVGDGTTSVDVQVSITCIAPSATDLSASPSTAYLAGEEGETPAFDLILANTTSDAIAFTVENLPAWLDVTPSADTVPANSTLSLVLTSTAPCPTTRSVLDGSFDVDFASGTLAIDAFEICADAPVNDYDVDIRFFGDGFDLDSINAFLRAAEKWESVITADLEDRSGLNTDAGDCSGPSFPNEPGLVNASVDDLLIYAGVSAIDGDFGVVGSAGPCIVRPGGSTDALLPVYGTAFFDSADVQRLQTQGRLDAVILHEMGHVIGIGTVWDNFDLVDYAPDTDPCRLTGSFTTAPNYTGPAGIAAYDALIAGTPASVPVEDEGGAGTQCGHWDEEVFDDELMTGTLDNAGDPLSALTGESLIDLGYATDPSAYEAYSIPACSPTCLVLPDEHGEHEEHGIEILMYPRYESAPDGTLTPL